MIGSGNTKTNLISRKPQQQYQKFDNLEKISTPKQKYYQNLNNNLNRNNLTGNNSKNKLNNRINMNLNNNMINSNMNKINNNINHGNNNIINTNNNINKALMVIRAEFKKKDDKIRELELKVAELENKINSITKTDNFQLNNNNIQISNNNYLNSNLNNYSQKKVGRNFTFSEKYSEEIKPSLNKTPDMNYNNRVNPFRNDDDYNNTNKNNFNTQNKSANQYKINSNNNNDNDYTLEKKGSKQNNYGDNARENSIITGNSSNFQGHTKMEVKTYLKEVKSRVNPILLKEFIQNIKLLTSSKEKEGVDKKSVVEKVRILFGEEFKDLYIKFESIIGIQN